MTVGKWESLPAEIYVKIFEHLLIDDRLNATRVCKLWNRFMNSPQLWYAVQVNFVKGSSDVQLRNIATNYGDFFRQLHIKCYQQAPDNCQNSRNFVRILASKKSLKLREFKLEFCEQNPFFYSGLVYLENLQKFFRTKSLSCITKIDLSKFPIAITDDFLQTLTKHHASHIEYLNIQNNTLVYQISRDTLLAFVNKARRLQYLYVQAICFCGNILRAFAKENRAKVTFVSLLFTRAGKYFKPVSNEEWLVLKPSLPDMRIEISFDHTFPLELTFRVMVPGAPVSILKLCLFATIIENVNLASSIYTETLEALSVTTTPSPSLDEAVLNIVKKCKKLSVLHVWCRMDCEVVNEILQLQYLKEFTLTST